MQAVVIEKTGAGQRVALKEFSDTDLMAGDVTVRIMHSTLNYKDGLALTGKAPVVRRFPMIPGIDFAGVVEQSAHPEFKPGDRVVLNGWGTGETHLGAYAEKSRVSGDWLIPLPDGIDTAQAMAIGTAGYTAMLALMALEKHGLKPAQGSVIVTGAAGGVGSIAITLLAKAGWDVIASTGRPHESDYLKSLGAASVIDRSAFAAPAKALAKERWITGIDTVGGNTLANVLSMTKYRGAVAACGLAGGMELPSSVAPFILRGVSLLGIDSVMAPKSERIEAWARLARDLDQNRLAIMSTTVPLSEVIGMGQEIVDGRVRGRIVVEIG